MGRHAAYMSLSHEQWRWKEICILFSTKISMEVMGGVTEWWTLSLIHVFVNDSIHMNWSKDVKGADARLGKEALHFYWFICLQKGRGANRSGFVKEKKYKLNLPPFTSITNMCQLVRLCEFLTLTSAANSAECIKDNFLPLALGLLSASSGHDLLVPVVLSLNRHRLMLTYRQLENELH